VYDLPVREPERPDLRSMTCAPVARAREARGGPRPAQAHWLRAHRPR